MDPLESLAGKAPSSASSLQSIRAYRSRRSRPCDRCRSRKQRCVILSDQVGARCLNCDLSQSECLFDQPPPPNASNSNRSASSSRKNTTPKGTAVAAAAESSTSGSSVATTSAPISAPYGIPTPSALTPPLASAPLSTSPHVTSAPVAHIASHPPPHFAFPAAPPPRQPRTVLSDLVRNLSQASTTASYYHQLHQPTEEYRALDLDANEDEELYLVGTASERDALQLSMSVGGGDHSSRTAMAVGPRPKPVPGLKVRHVSTDPRSPAAFVLMKTKPYAETPAPSPALDDLLRLVGPSAVERLMQNYLRIDGLALPIWSQEHFAADPKISHALQCSYITSSLVYEPNLRHLQHEAWGITRAVVRMREPRARLSTIQATLVDLNGRDGVDPAGNYVRLGTAVQVARLLGLDRDCSTWTIPLWERDLRTRLWWALLVYDKVSALTFGRGSVIGYEDGTLPLPRRSPGDSPSYDAFVSLCELTLILDDLNRRLRASRGASNNTSTLEVLADIGLRLDKWRSLVDERTLFSFLPGDAPPGVRSLQLAYEYLALVVAREAWTAVSHEGPAVVNIAQRASLAAATEFVDFVTGLVQSELTGYWASHSPFFISTCLTVLVRLALESDRKDTSTNAVRQLAVHTLRRLISYLSDARRDASWDVADLALARAHFFIPLLSRQAPEFEVVLQPLQSAWPAPPVDEALEEFLNSFVQETYPNSAFDVGGFGGY